MKRFASLSLTAVLMILLLLPDTAAAGKPVIDHAKLSANIEELAKLPSLYEIYQDYFLISTPFNATFAGNTYFPVVQQHYNAIWMGNIMKPDTIAPSKDRYNYAETDRVAKIAKDAGIDISGHTLLWHSQSPRWLNKNSDGTPLPRAEAMVNMTDFINNVAGHYAGVVYAWDVVNEAMQDGLSSKGDWKTGLRQSDSAWYMAFANGANQSKGESGADYIDTAFRLARAADPEAILYYNDYNLDNQNKAAAVADMVKEINDKWLAEGNDRLLIEGVGMQGHYDINVNLGNVEASIKRFIALGVEISITEMELALYGYNENQNWGKTPTQQLYEKQAEVYAKLFILFKQYSDNIRRVNCNGIYLPDAWKNDTFPTLFDENGGIKPAYFAVADPEGYLAGNLDTEAQHNAWVKNGGPSAPVPEVPEVPENPEDPVRIPVPAKPTRSAVFVNGNAAAFEAYGIDGYNYFKLRDLAYVLNKTEKQFAVDYNDETKAITLTSGAKYTPEGAEMTQGNGKPKDALPTASKITLDGRELELTFYAIGGYNFVKLRDLMEALDVFVGYDDQTRSITLETAKNYIEP